MAAIFTYNEHRLLTLALTHPDGFFFLLSWWKTYNMKEQEFPMLVIFDEGLQKLCKSKSGNVGIEIMV